jgi:predicted transcriptional regulator
VSGLLQELRSVVPARPLGWLEAYMVSERQAALLLRHQGVTVAPVPSEVISELPFVTVAVRSLPGAGGASRWIKPRWIILLNGDEPPLRRRFSLAHEFKHLIDHEYQATVYGSTLTKREIERVCDYFAACLLMPRPWIKMAFASGIQDVDELASVFAVSQQAMQVRLLQLGLIDPRPRCCVIDNSYLRSLPLSPANVAA